MLVYTSTWALVRGHAEDDCMLSGKRRFTTLPLLNVLSVLFFTSGCASCPFGLLG